MLYNNLPTARKSSYTNICKHFINLNNFPSQVKTQEEQARCRHFLAWRTNPILPQGKWFKANIYLVDLYVRNSLMEYEFEMNCYKKDVLITFGKWTEGNFK